MRIEIFKAINKYKDSPEFMGLAVTTKKNYSSILVNFEVWVNKIPRNHDEKIFQSYLACMLRSGNKFESVKLVETVLKTCFKYSDITIDTKLVKTNDQKQASNLKDMARPLTLTDMHKINGYILGEYDNNDVREGNIPLKNEVVFNLLIDTGCRVSEIENMEINDFDLDQNSVVVTKSKSVPRIVFYSNSTKKLLGRFLSFAKHPPDKLFGCKSSIQKAWRKMLDELGLYTDGRGVHMVRHYTASKLFYIGGMSIESVAYLLGDKVDTIRETYLHPFPESLKDEVFNANGWQR